MLCVAVVELQCKKVLRLSQMLLAFIKDGTHILLYFTVNNHNVFS